MVLAFFRRDYGLKGISVEEFRFNGSKHCAKSEKINGKQS